MGTMKKLKPHQELRRQRREIDMTQEELAQELGISASLLSRWESGSKDRVPTDDQRKAWKDTLAAALEKKR